MRISDWSSDVCSSDLDSGVAANIDLPELNIDDWLQVVSAVSASSGKSGARPGDAAVTANASDVTQYVEPDMIAARTEKLTLLGKQQSGRASCRERVCQYV